MSWLPHVLGLDDPAGRWELFWSGFGSDLGELAIVSGLLAHYRRLTCHVDSPRFCWRPGVHPVEGTPYRTCKKHHPDVPDQISPLQIRMASTRARKGGEQ